jgi:cytoskeletal protein CcmA (bactofilin family)
MRNKSSGFTLIVVLVLISMATIVVLSSMNDAVMQERLSGNFQKKLNARLASEKGFYDSVAQLNTAIADNPNMSIEDLVANNSNKSSDELIEDSQYAANVSINSDGNVVIASEGTKFEGKSSVLAVYEYVPGSSASTNNSVVSPGITGCSMVLVERGGDIDSYDSRLGDYLSTLDTGEVNQSEEAFVHTLNDSDGITLNGGTSVKGDIVSSGDVLINGGSSLSGSVYANGNIIVQGGSTVGADAASYLTYTQSSGSIGGNIFANSQVTLSQVPVGGDVSSQSSVNVTGNTVQGSLFSGADTKLSQANIKGNIQVIGDYTQTGQTVEGDVTVKGDVSLTQWGSKINGDLRYQGSGSFQGDNPQYYNPPYSVSQVDIDTSDNNPLATAVEQIETTDDVHQGITSCDLLDIANEIEDADNTAVEGADLLVGGYGNQHEMELGTYQANYLRNGQSTTDGDIYSVSGEFLGTQTQIYYVNDLLINGELTIKQNEHAVLLVRGDLTMNASGSLTIPDNSSLTLIIRGKLSIGEGAQVYTPDNGITDSNRPVLSIYSDYDGSDGIVFNGGTEEIYAVIYAPFTDVKIESRIQFKGSILADTVTVRDAGGVHFDVALSGSSFAGSTTGTSTSGYLVFKELLYDTQ